MCGRFSLSNVSDILKRFNLSLPDFLPRYNVSPSQEVLAIVNDQTYQLKRFQWGLIPFWSKEKSSGMINARAETVEKKPSFKHSFKRRRCLIPADGFYEWKKESTGKKPYRFILKTQVPFNFAGLWDTWTSPEGLNIQSCTIITTVANELVSSVHHRMPVILSEDAEVAWLSHDVDVLKLKELMHPFSSQQMEGYKISSLVNSPQNDCPEIVRHVKKL